uniref:Membrane protein BRI3 n=1 Tax=Daphnia galeata TaxID=27404 RepID=A0A8J2RN94_9CRUS|nr:unnamed protein product [Daphnia galeata]
MSETSVHVPIGEARVIHVGGCPACRVGVMKYYFTCTGILLAIIFFPLGLLCLFGLQEQRCSHCGVVL